MLYKLDLINLSFWNFKQAKFFSEIPYEPFNFME
jgi:hypothetical protein